MQNKSKNNHLQVTVYEDSCAILLILPAQTQWGLSGFLSITERRAITLPVWCSKLPKHFGLDGGGCWLVNFMIPFSGKLIASLKCGQKPLILSQNGRATTNIGHNSVSVLLEQRLMTLCSEMRQKDVK